MSWDEYWNEDSTRVIYYRQAYEMKRKIENTNMWLQGRYIYEAVGNLSPILNAFSKKREPVPYPSEPYPITEKEVKEREERELKAFQEKVKQRIMQFNKNKEGE